MSDQARLADLITLNRLSLTGAKAVHTLLLEGTPPGEILRKIREENFLKKQDALLELDGKFDAVKEMQTAERLGIQILTVLDARYPQALMKITDPPLVLYVMGTIEEADSAAVSIVGTRHPSYYGTAQTRKFTRELSEKGFTVVSGLAQGIDQIAHQTALAVPYGRTLAVLGCGLDIDYPSGSKKLKEAIAARGAVITEYAFGTSPRAENFPRRNRIIAGLSQGTLVIEAHSKSGSLITAHLAAEEGREVFAVPGAVDQLGSRGTHHLIKEGAHLAENAEDVVSVLGSIMILQSEKRRIQPVFDFPDAPEAEMSEKSVPAFSAEKKENEIIAILKEHPMSGMELSERMSWVPSKVGSALTLLEIEGKVKRQTDGRFAALRT